MPCMRPVALRRAALCTALSLVLCITAACAAAPTAPDTSEIVDVLVSHTPSPVAATPAAACNVPDLRLETEAYARKALTNLGINDVTVEYIATADIPAGLVAEQSVKSGDCPQDGAPFKLLVSVPLP
ncbi:MAG: PASTA domain-containing protein, partial [Clostridia bacterium]|nr:PASTA domain-containing protein [Clostridia bacterium]